MKKIKNIFFYGLPDDKQLFRIMLRKLDFDLVKDSQGYNAVIAFFSRVERYNFEKIVGEQTAGMVFKKKKTSYQIN